MIAITECVKSLPLLRKKTAVTASSSAATRTISQGLAVSPIPVQDEQIQALLHHLFFRRTRQPVRHVGFAASEAGPANGQLCLSVAHALAASGRYDVGVIDAVASSALPSGNSASPAEPSESQQCQIANRLWLVPYRSWLPDETASCVSEESFARLGEIASQFDFAIVSCPPVSPLTLKLGLACDGLVLVLTANTTRRLAAQQMKLRLESAGVALLGTVLTERRFPVPEGLYRKL